MRNKKQVNVFVSDRIHNAGIELLDSKFNVYKKYELSNDELLAFISSVGNKSSLIDVLVIRSNRKLDANFIKAGERVTPNKALRMRCAEGVGGCHGIVGYPRTFVAYSPAAYAAQHTQGFMLGYPALRGRKTGDKAAHTKVCATQMTGGVG